MSGIAGGVVMADEQTSEVTGEMFADGGSAIRSETEPETEPEADDMAVWQSLVDGAAAVASAAHRHREEPGAAPANESRSRDAQEDTHRDGYPHGIMHALHVAGLLAAPLPIALGGAGLGVARCSRRALLSVLREVGRADLSAGRLFEGHVDALLTIAQFGTEEQITRVAAQVKRGGVFGVWNTGPGSGGVTITPAGDCFALEGRKTFASGAGRLAGAIVTGALPDGGWQMCLAPMAALQRQGSVHIDASSWHPMGMQGSASYTIDFASVALPAPMLLGEAGDYYRQPRFTGGALRFAAVQLGGAERLVDATCAFLRDTGRADDPYQIARIGDMVMLVAGGVARLTAGAEVAESFALASAVDPAAPSDMLLVHANMARTDIAAICLRVCELTERSVGARGLLAPHAFAAVIRDLHMYLRQPAPDAALADIGRFALADARRIGVLFQGIST